MRPDTSKFLGIQSLRTIAAFLVLFQHVTFYVLSAKEIDYVQYLRIDFGRNGVILFFVISGFVMAQCMKEGRLFLFNRALRIYPSYWIAIIFSYLILGSFINFHFDAASFFLIPTDDVNNTYKIPYWTLIYEVFFYFMVYLISLISKTVTKIAGICGVWLFFIFAFNAYHPVQLKVPGSLIIFSPINFCFITGLLVALHKDLLQKSKSILMLLVSIVVWGISLNLADVNPHILKSISFGILIFISKNEIIHPALAKLGDYSYGIYLLHVPIVLTAIHLIQKYHPTLSLRYYWPLCLLITVFFSICFGNIENKLYLSLKALVKRKKQGVYSPKFSAPVETSEMSS